MERNSKAVLLFDGYGSHYFNMGQMLYKSNDTFRHTLLSLDKKVNHQLNISIIGYIYDDKKKSEPPIENFRNAHLALYMIQYAMTKTLHDDFNIYPSYVLGNSFGEIVALVASGAMDPMDTLSVIINQIDSIEKSCQAESMIVISVDTQFFDRKLFINNLPKEVNAVNSDYAESLILSGSIQSLLTMGEYLNKKNISYKYLPLCYRLHSHLLDNAQTEFISHADQIKFSKPMIPLVSGIYGRTLDTVTPDYLWLSIRMQTKFNQAISFLETTGEYFYIDCSPSGNLQKICSKIISKDSASIPYSIMTPFKHELERLKTLKRRPDINLPHKNISSL